jgi:hypothetical protein
MRVAIILFCLATVTSSLLADDFWSHWGDGKAEINAYQLTQPRYGAKRSGKAVLIFVAEEMSDSLRVKADPGKHPPSDVYPVMKLNSVRRFQTGIYDYDVMTSVFSRVAPSWPLAKVSFSSREWCGHVYHQLLFRGGRIEGTFHSYFDGEADGKEDLSVQPGGIVEDALPILLRGLWKWEMNPGESRTLPYLPSLLRTRLDHKPLAWGRAVLSRGVSATKVSVPAGSFTVVTWTVVQEGGPTVTYAIEAAPPFRLVRWSVDTGEEAFLLGSARLAYWKLNAPGGEVHLKELGLVPASR